MRLFVSNNSVSKRDLPTFARICDVCRLQLRNHIVPNRRHEVVTMISRSRDDGHASLPPSFPQILEDTTHVLRHLLHLRAMEVDLFSSLQKSFDRTPMISRRENHRRRLSVLRLVHLPLALNLLSSIILFLQRSPSPSETSRSHAPPPLVCCAAASDSANAGPPADARSESSSSRNPAVGTGWGLAARFLPPWSSFEASSRGNTPPPSDACCDRIGP